MKLTILGKKTKDKTNMKLTILGKKKKDKENMKLTPLGSLLEVLTLVQWLDNEEKISFQSPKRIS